MTPITWEDPPNKGGKTSDATGFAEQLKKKPGKWAIVRVANTATRASGYAQVIRDGRTKAWMPAGSFESAARTVEGEYRVYARYVGE